MQRKLSDALWNSSPVELNLPEKDWGVVWRHIDHAHLTLNEKFPKTNIISSWCYEEHFCDIYAQEKIGTSFINLKDAFLANQYNLGGTSGNLGGTSGKSVQPRWYFRQISSIGQSLT